MFVKVGPTFFGNQVFTFCNSAHLWETSHKQVKASHWLNGAAENLDEIWGMEIVGKLLGLF